MRHVRAWLVRLCNLFRPSPADRDLAAEIDAHLDLHVEDNLRAGMTTDAARRDARAKLGGIAATIERHRDSRRLPLVDALVQDVRFAVRTLRRSPAFSLVAVLTLAFGTGVTTALFAVVYAVLVNPFPFTDAERLVNIRMHGRTGPPSFLFLTAAQLSALRQADVVEDAAAIDTFSMTLTGQDVPEHLRTQYYSANGLQMLGAQPALGRVFAEADGPVGQEPSHVVVLAHAFWQQQFGGRVDAIGQTLNLDQVPYTVIGVMSERLTGIDILVPIHLRLDPQFAWSVLTRLKPGVSMKTAEARLQPLFEQFAKEAPTRFPRDFRLEITSLIDQRRTSPFAPTLTLVFVAAIVLLLVACVTTSILLLARGSARRHELAVRHAIGASRRRLLQQMLTESLVLALIGVVTGVGVAYLSVPVALRQLPRNAIPVASPHIDISGPLLLFSASLALATALLFGLSPALSLSRRRAMGLLQSGMAKVAGNADSRRAHQVFVVVQVALTVLLLSGTGAAARGLLVLYRSYLGYDPANVLLVNASLPEGSHQQWSERALFFDRLREQMAQLPQVEAVGLGIYTQVPPRAGPRSLIEIPGQQVSRDQFPIVQLVSADYLSSLKVPVVLGRVWSRSETMQAARVAVINRAMARAFWAEENPIGRRVYVPQLAKTTSQFVLAAPGTDGWLEIVGVVGDTPNVGLREAPVPAMYAPYSLMIGDMATFSIRTAGDPMSLAQSIREQVRGVDPNQAITDIRTAEQVLAENGWARERFVMLLMFAFGAFALLLAAVGLFSVVSFAVSQRLREFGIRIALGARGADVVHLALASPLLSIGGGLAFGILLSAAANRILASWSIGNLADPIVLAVVGLALAAAAVAAVMVPVARAVSIQPATALRVE